MRWKNVNLSSTKYFSIIYFLPFFPFSRLVAKNSINMKGLVHHTPTDEDISNVLKEFTVDFLLKAYSSLVQDLHNGFLCDNEMVFFRTLSFFPLFLVVVLFHTFFFHLI